MHSRPAPDPAAAPDTTDHRWPPVRSGQVIGRYRLGTLLGEGGMAHVYSGEDLDTGERVALKLLRPELTTDRAVLRRFYLEALAASKVLHPGIIRILGSGIDDADAPPYIAMEHVDGHSLRELLDEREDRRLAPDEVGDLGFQIVETLAAAHAAGVVHRDIKPDNILVVRGDDGRRRTKILDFGIAKLMADVWGSGLTRTGTMLGTPAYMAPEQATDTSGVDHRADIYSLGCLFYECLAGAPPFRSTSPMGLLLEHLEAAPPPLTGLVPQLPAPFAELILHMLAKRPELRPASMLEVRDRLAQAAPTWGGGEPPTRRDELVASLEQRRLAARRTVVRLDTEPADDGDPWSALAAVLPPKMWDDEPVLRALFSQLFARGERRTDRSLRLHGPTFAAHERSFHAAFVAGQPSYAQALGRVETQLFLESVRPLARELDDAGGPAGTVVIAIVDAAEIGPGVREVILECRRKYGIIAVPLYLGELRRMHRDGQLGQLFHDRVVDLLSCDDPFSLVGPSPDPIRCVGMSAQVNGLVSLIAEGGNLLSIVGPPGCGKSTLISLAEYGCENELGGRTFVYVDCDDASHHDPLRFVADLRAKLAEAGAGAATTATADIRGTVATFVRDRRVVLVLDNADWLIRVSQPDYRDRERRDRARELWTALAENARDHSNTVLIASVRGLDTVLVRETYRPPHVRSLLVAPLDRAGTDKVVHELGRCIDLRADARAVDRLHRDSGGNVYVLRSLCSTVVARARARGPLPPFAPLSVTARDVAAAYRHLCEQVQIFDRHVWETLDVTERRVLHHVARRRPRSLRAIRRALGDVEGVDVTGAVKSLQDMGYLHLDRKRHAVAVPLLAEWVRRNLDTTRLEDQQRRRRRLARLALGTSLTAVMFAVYWAWLSSSWSQVKATVDRCAVTADYPDRAGSEEAVLVHVRARCPAGAAPSIALEPDAATVTPRGACGAGAPCQFDVKLLPQAPSRYPFIVRVGGREALSFSIARDPLAWWRLAFGQAFQIASFLPMLLGLFLAFHREVRMALARLFRLQRAVGGDPVRVAQEK